MATPRFLADENIETATVRATHRLEPAVEFIALREAGLLEASDPEVLEYAYNQTLIVVSHDVRTMINFAAERISAGRGVAGLFVVPVAAPPRIIAESLILAWGASTAEEWIDQIVFLPF